MKISAVVITKNEEKNIKDCLSCLDWVGEIVVIDSNSDDKTREIAKKMGAKIYICSKKGFDERRNLGKEKAQGEWLLYVDADERISDKLKKEILTKIKNPEDYSAFKIPRFNTHYGKPMRHGGWYPDYQTRLIKKENLKHWQGIVHESPKIEGKIGKLVNCFIHLTHRSIKESFQKSVQWTRMEADILFGNNNSKVTIFTLIKVSLKEFIFRVFIKKGFLDGSVSWLEGMIQAFNKFLVYAQLWEKQQKSSR